MVVEVIDAPWAGIPVRIRWHKRRWMWRERTCQIATFIEQNHSVCAPRARLGVRAIRQLCFEGATILGLARQLGTTWNTVWSPIKPCLHAASEPRPPSQEFGHPESMRGVWHHHDRRRRGPRAHRHRGSDSREGSSHGPLEWTWPRAGLEPCTRTGWPSADKTSARECESRMLDPPSRDSKNTITCLLQGRNQRARRLSHRQARR